MSSRISMKCNIWKSCANQHIYLHLQKHTIKKKPQMFLPSLGRNALLIRECYSICTRGKCLCLATAVIPEPLRTKHTLQLHFSDAQGEQGCNPGQNPYSLGARRKAPGWDLSHTGCIRNSFPEAPAGITKSRFGTGFRYLVESFASLPGGTHCKGIKQCLRWLLL